MPRAAVRLALALVAAASLSTACSGSSAPTSAPTPTAVRSLLRAHAAALHAHDRAAWLAGVSTADRDALFRQQQSDEFDNLAKVPLASWSYSVVGAESDPTLLAAARRKYGAPASVVHVSLDYAIRGADPHPTSRDLYWTFLRQGGQVVIAGDDDAESLGATTWKGPWDFGPLSVARGRFGIAFGHPGYEAVLDSVIRDVDDAVPAVTAVWGTDWPRFVAVVVTASKAEFDATVGGTAGAGPDSVAALAVNDGTDPVHETTVGRRLVISPGELQRLSPIGRQILLRHEITHLAAADATTDATPTWLREGFADYVADLHTGQPVTTVAAELTAAVRRGQLPDQLPTDAAFTGDAATAALAYEQAWLACRLIAERAGQAGLLRVYRLVGGQATASSTATASALRAVLHESTAQFTAQWRTFLRQLLG